MEEQCDIVVLEVGLGGRLDSTNVIPAPEAAVITNIGLEHTQELGGTLTLIAREKSGILKPGCRAVLYRQSDEVTQVIQSVCRQLDIPPASDRPPGAGGPLLRSGGPGLRYRGRGPYRLSPAGQLPALQRHHRPGGGAGTPGCRLDHPGGGGSLGLAAAQWPGRLELARRSPRLHRGRRPQPPVRGRPCRRPGEPLPRPEAHFPLRCPGR